jgi:hypothetical protein
VDRLIEVCMACQRSVLAHGRGPEPQCRHETLIGWLLRSREVTGQEGVAGAGRVHHLLYRCLTV